MAIISSRLDLEAERVRYFQKIIKDASHGFIGDNTEISQVAVGDDLDELIDQAEKLLKTLNRVNLRLSNDNRVLKNQLEVAQDTLANLVDNVEYDDALDHATADLMDCFCGNADADVSADGKLVFHDRATFAKSDIKPMFREALIRWLELKLSK